MAAKDGAGCVCVGGGNAAVAAQMDALQINDWPEPDAGGHTAVSCIWGVGSWVLFGREGCILCETQASCAQDRVLLPEGRLLCHLLNF
jgi:hypothetical protein